MIAKTYRFWRLYGARGSLSKLRDVVGPAPIQKVYQYWRQQGLVNTTRQIAHVVANAIPASELVGITEAPEHLLRRQLVAMRGVPTRVEAPRRPRLNLVTDSINPPHLYGGVGTALIFATLLAERLGWPLRIVTRNDRARAENYRSIVKLAGLLAPEEVEYAFINYSMEPPSLPVTDGDCFLTTSWWTTLGTRQTIASRRIIYLLQEDERMFYSGGEEHLRCAEILADPELTFVVNTRLLHEYLLQSGLTHLAHNGVWFEPAFPKSLFYPPADSAKRSQYRFLYYARPNNARNLFCRGLEAIEAAIDSKVLLPDEWELYFVGKDIPALRFHHGFVPQRFENLSWQSYAELVRDMDLGLSLMYTPHPSYPPLDLAASGAVVVTNRFGEHKHSLAQYSQNILCAEPTVEGLLRGIEQGVALAKDSQRRRENYQRSGLLRDWQDSFRDALTFCAQRFS